jgi:hypothetical protein
LFLSGLDAFTFINSSLLTSTNTCFFIH